MHEEINGLREALQHSPENIPLRLLLAESLFRNGQWPEAETEFKIILDKQPTNAPARLGLARVYFEQKKYPTTIVILEEYAEQNPTQVEPLVLLSRALLRNQERAKAMEGYKRVLALNPAFKDDELDQQLRHPSGSQTADEQLDEIETHFHDAEKPAINFEQVGGMDSVKEEINIKIIQPLEHPEMYKAFGKKIGGGILLYGPPGCGKTHLARATAGQIQASFLSVGIHDVLDMWMGNSEKQLHDVFEAARQQAPCVLFFDEIDALGSSRSDMRQSSAKMLINQFLNELDGVQSSNDGLLILGATNAPWHLDAAFRRPGRFDRILFIPPPDQAGREEILKILMKEKPAGAIDWTLVAKQTPEFSGADLMSVVDRAVEVKLRESFQSGKIQALATADLVKASKEVKASTREWFVTARNYALYSNESGQYDDILSYLKIKK
jgi:SpoVK/Ycf46/Vps4 family AAA+-type ATPase